MGFVDDLKNGRPGLRLAIPESWKVHEEHPRRAVFLDNERRVGWHVAHAPLALDLRREHDEVLRRDIERHGRHVFAEQYAQLKLPPELLSRRPPCRTGGVNGADWSPILAVTHVELGGAPALWILRRLSYEPSLEVVLSTVLVPLGTGMLEITAFHRSAESGSRESFLVNMALQQHPGKRPEEVTRLLGQAFLDDAKHDEQFPASPVALARRAGRWLLDEKDLIQVLQPAPTAPVEVELGPAECTLVPPPRYLPIATQGLGVPPTMNVLTRVMLDATDNPRVLDVWYLPETVLTGDDRQEQLLALARGGAADWEKQGATEVESDVRALPPDGERLRAATSMQMRIGGAKAQSVMRWIGEPDGRVYRISIGAPGYVPREELEAEADQAMGSLRKKVRVLRDAWLTNDSRLRPATPAA